MRIVITGVAGFIGSALARRLLAEGHEVIGIDNLSGGRADQIPAGCRFIRDDVRSAAIGNVFRPGDVVFHLAAMTDLGECQRDPVMACAVNVFGSVNVFQCAAVAGAGRVIYAETSALYEGCVVLPSTERRRAPRSVYATSKEAARLFAQCYRRFTDLTLVGCRYFNVYGPAQADRAHPPLMAGVIRAILRGEPPVVNGDGSKRRDFIHIDDVTAFHLKLMAAERNVLRDAYNVGSGQNYSVREIIDQIGALMHSGGPIFGACRFAPDQAWEAAETLADIRMARRLGWAPGKSLAAGLADQIAWERAHAEVSA